MIELIMSFFILTGGFFAFVAALGIVRLPDVLIRMHASTKAGTLASGLIMVAVAMYFGDTQTVAKCIVIVVFLLITAPVGAHMIGRAAFRAGVKLWEPTTIEPGVREKLNLD